MALAALENEAATPGGKRKKKRVWIVRKPGTDV